MPTCYFQNGQEATGSKSPCNETAVAEGKHSSCCNTSHQCLTNGLCRDPHQEPAENYYWRIGCTDPTFQDPACPRYCPGYSETTYLVWKCQESEKWCCNGGAVAPLDQRIHRSNTSCCSVNDLVFPAPEPVVYATAAPHSTAFTRSTIAFTVKTSKLKSVSKLDSFMTTSVAPKISTTPPSVSDSASMTTLPISAYIPAASSTSNRLAIGLGVSAAVLFLITIGVILCSLRRRKAVKAGDAPQPIEAFEIPGQQYSEMTGEGISELMGSDCVELLAEGTKENQIAQLCDNLSTQS
ncbi:hypothetical protein DM02DRAFT_333850 [Periconia macrospinosa]|uniref:Mid2 domain-containing protein n=1 Tax=Periconia macrospinosa TaxID=97972 RepID=A0A2V1DUV1_9PLEO|nr:hypothetical protein DM02DRAFT_333850 [Periconia macrospinosa]